MELNDEEQVLAWCEWRKWCSIERVKSPHPTQQEKQEYGWSEDYLEAEKRNQLYSYLLNLIFAKANKWLSQELATIGARDIDVKLVKKDFIAHFDAHFFKNYANQGGERLPLPLDANHKDYLFYRAQKSQEPFLQCIMGMLFKKFYVRDIIREYISDLYPSLADRIKAVRKNSSGNEPLSQTRVEDDENERLLEETVAAREPEYVTPLIQEQADEYANEFLDTLRLTVREKILLLAFNAKIRLEDTVLQKAAGVGRAVCGETQKSALAKLRSAAYDVRLGYDLFSRALVRSINKRFISELKAEKGLKPFLDKVKTNLNSELSELSLI